MIHSALKTIAQIAAFVACAALALASVFALLETIRPAPTPPMTLDSPEWVEFMTAR
jgi:hypothetical protein